MYFQISSLPTMAANVNLSQDLPLAANYHQFEAFHHILDLRCHFRRKVFEGSLVFFLKAGSDWTELTQFRVVLDCSDIDVTSVEELNDIDTNGTSALGDLALNILYLINTVVKEKGQKSLCVPCFSLTGCLFLPWFSFLR